MSQAAHRNIALDGMRGVAALMVMALHFTEKNGTATIGDRSLFGSSYLAVDLFFVLSGFVIHRSYAQALGGPMSVQDYVLKRAIRLYPMFLLGTCLGLVSLLMTSGETALLSKAAILRDFSFNALGLPAPNADAIYELGGRAANMGELYPTNPPSWSLFFEMIASLGFVFVLRFDEAWLLRLAGAALAGSVVCGALVSFQAGVPGLTLGLGWSSANFLAGFPRVIFSFAVGVYLARRFARSPVGSLSALHAGAAALFLYSAVFCCLVLPNVASGLYALAFVAVVSPAMVFAAAHVHLERGFVKRASEFLGWLSFPLYCVHFPVGRIVWRLGHKYALADGTTVLIGSGASLGVAVLAAWLYDAPVRKLISALAFRKTPVLPDARWQARAEPARKLAV